MAMFSDDFQGLKLLFYSASRIERAAGKDIGTEEKMVWQRKARGNNRPVRKTRLAGLEKTYFLVLNSLPLIKN
ncbi:MAG: hypothetical protein V4805_19490 [Pseudomonadota bacterium]